MHRYNIEISQQKSTSAYPFSYADDRVPQLVRLVQQLFGTAVFWLPPTYTPDIFLHSVTRRGDNLDARFIYSGKQEVGSARMPRYTTLTNYAIASAGCVRGFVGVIGKENVLAQLLDCLGEGEVLDIPATYGKIIRALIHLVGGVRRRAVRVNGIPVSSIQFGRGIVFGEDSKVSLFAETPVPAGVSPIVRINTVEVSGDIFLTEADAEADLHVSVGETIKISAITE